MTAISVNKVVFEAQESYSRRWEALGELFRTLGLSWPRATALLDPASKSLAVYLCSAARFGERKFTIAVRRELALTDCLEAAQREGRGVLADLLTDGAEVGIKPFKMFPTFVDEALLPTGALDKAALVDAIVEKGEGHGPRKEFFICVGREMCGAGADGSKGTSVPRVPGGIAASHQLVNRQGSYTYSSRPGSSLLPPFDNTGITKRSVNGISQPASNNDLLEASERLATASAVGARPASLFSYVRSAGQYWIDRTLSDSDPQLPMLPRITGWILGQALTNRSVMGVPLPPQLFQVLMAGSTDWAPSMASLRQFDIEAARSLEKLREVGGRELADFLEMEGLERTMTIEEYLQHSVKDYFCSGTQALIDEMKKGWDAAVDTSVLSDCHVSAWDLAEMVCGPAHGLLHGAMLGATPPDIWSVFRVSEDAEVNRATPELYIALRKVVRDLAPENYRAFLRFVTGSDRLPLPGTELLRIEVPFTPLTPDEHEDMLRKLPQAHTCDNTLEIPNYFESLCVVRGGAPPEEIDAGARSALVPELEQLVREKLLLAIISCDGYGLDAS